MPMNALPSQAPHRPESQSRILDEALPLFFQHGYRGLSMDELSRRLGMSKKTLYQHFPSKEALAAAAIQRRQRALETAYEAICAQTSDPLLRFRRIMAEVGQMLGAVTPQFMDGLSREVPSIWQQVVEFREQRIRRVLQDLLSEGVQRGQVRADLPAELVIETCLAAVQRVVTPQVLMHSSFSAREAIEGIVDLVLTGVLSPAARSSLAAEPGPADDCPTPVDPITALLFTPFL
jgi:AcrR family transcriptional regulator